MTHEQTRAPQLLAPWRNLLLYVAPTLLVVVAVQHLALTRLHHLNPWKGGGFAMFSSIDSPGLRVVRAFLVDGGRDVPITLPAGDALEENMSQLRTLPSPSRLGDLAGTLATRSWRITGGVAIPQPGAPVRPSAGTAIRVEVYRIRFYSDTTEIAKVLIASASRDLQ
jgi:hypothetical protein